jgi:hypothetical protein
LGKSESNHNQTKPKEMNLHLDKIIKEIKRFSRHQEIGISDEQIEFLAEHIFTEVYLKYHGWQKLLSQGEHGTHEGLGGIYYLVDGFGKVHEKYCKRFR